MPKSSENLITSLPGTQHNIWTSTMKFRPRKHRWVPQFDIPA